MSKGQEIKLNFVDIKNETTQDIYTRLTPLDTTCHRNYFYQKCFTNDSKHLLFAGEFDQNLNYYLLNLENQTAQQLTEGSGDNTFGGFLSCDDKYLYYVKNSSKLQKVNLKTLQEKTIYKGSSEWIAYGTWVANSETTKIVGIEIHKNDYKSLPTWDAFKQMFHDNPLCRLFSIDLKTGEQTIIYQEKRWLGHPIYRPFNDEIISFCHEGPHDLVESRIWMINADGTNMRPIIKNKKAGECFMHEFFVPDGSAMIYVGFKANINKRFLHRYNIDDNSHELLMQMPSCSHIMSNYDGSLLVGDGIGTPEDVVDTQSFEIEKDENIYIFNIKRGKYYSVGLHKSSWQVYKKNRQLTHPHPSFNLDSNKILYSSDFEGEVAVYLLNHKSSSFKEQ